MNRAGRKLIGTVACVAAAVVSLAPAASAHSDSSAEVAACKYFVYPPYINGGGQVEGKGGRTGCGSTPVKLKLVVRKRIDDAPDRQVAETIHDRFVTGYLLAAGKCKGQGLYFSEVRVEGTATKVQSEAVKLC